MKLFAAGIATETNTFSPLPTGLDDFLVVRGTDVQVGHVVYPSLDLSATWGRQAAARSYEFVFSLNAWAEPAGLTARRAYESLRDEVLSDLRAAMPVDIVLLNLHGAMVAHGYDDCEADIISRIRQIVGRQAVIAAELDLHCHLTTPMLADADLLVTYKEYPHVDINERAAEVFDLAVATKLGAIRPTMAVFDCRMSGLYPTSRQPLRGLVDELVAAEQLEGVVSVSFAHGFPFADLPHIGAKMLVITDNDRGLAERLARELGRKVYAVRRQIGFDSLSLPLTSAFERALSNHGRPVVIADQSDNVGAGAPGDATFVLRWLVEHDVDAAVAILHDPEAVKIARKAGVGARIPVRLGGKLAPSSGDPLDLEVTVRALRDNYLHARPQLSGKPLHVPIGDVAALSCGRVDIVVGSRRSQCYCPSIFRDLDIDPLRKHILIPKSYQHFYQGFAPIAREVIYMVAEGAVPPDPLQISYRRLDVSRLYPWDSDPLSGQGDVPVHCQ